MFLPTNISTVEIRAVILSKICKIQILYLPFYHPFNSHRHPYIACLYFHMVTKWLILNTSLIILPNTESKIFISKYNQNIMCIPLWITNYKVVKNHSHKRCGVLFVGRLDENKGVSILEKIDENILLKVVTVSTANLMRDNVEYYHNIDDIDLYSMYRGSLITIIPSKYESFSYVQLESMLQGTPVITSLNVKINDFIQNEFVKMVDFMNCDITHEINDFIKQIKVNDNFENILSHDAEMLMEESKNKFLHVLQSFESVNNKIIISDKERT